MKEKTSEDMARIGGVFLLLVFMVAQTLGDGLIARAFQVLTVIAAVLWYALWKWIIPKKNRSGYKGFLPAILPAQIGSEIILQYDDEGRLIAEDGNVIATYELSGDPLSNEEMMELIQKCAPVGGSITTCFCGINVKDGPIKKLIAKMEARLEITKSTPDRSMLIANIDSLKRRIERRPERGIFVRFLGTPASIQGLEMLLNQTVIAKERKWFEWN